MVNQVCSCLSRLIRGIRDPAQSQFLQNQILVSCVQLGQTLLKGSTNLQRLQWQISKSIISVLSTIEKKWDPYQLDYPIDSNLKNYVNVWFHLVTVGSGGAIDGQIKSLSTEPWSESAENSLTLFASKSPLLYQYITDMETDIELSSLFTSAEPSANEESLKTALIKRLGESHAEEIKALTHTSALYLFTVYEVESRRTKQLRTLKGIFSYFKAFTDTTHPLYPVLLVILETIFHEFVQLLDGEDRSEMTEAILEDHMEFLIIMLCHRFEVLQDISLRYICLLLEHYSFLKTNARCLNVLLKCLLTMKINLKPLNEAPVMLKESEMLMLKNDTRLHYQLDLPLSSEKLTNVYKKAMSVFSTWMDKGDSQFEEEVLINLQKSERGILADL